MKAEFQRRLIDSTPMAASPPPLEGAEAVVSAAIQAGIALIRDHGRLVPLWVLLDVVALRSHPSGFEGIPPERRADMYRYYDDWLSAFLAVQASRLGPPGEVRRGPKLDCLAALACCWPSFVDKDVYSPWKIHNGRSIEWIGAYRTLATRVAEILTAWYGPRRPCVAGWEALAAALKKRERLNSVDGALIDAFLHDRPDGPVYEWFDAAAAHIYLAANDFDVGPTRAAQRLSQTLVSRSQDLPEVDAIERPHHALGVMDLGVLTQGKFGIYKIINQSHPRIAGEPRSQPPRRVRIHLEWEISFASLEKPTPLASDLNLPGIGRTAELEAACVSHASVLQAVVALLADDWRNLLIGVSAELLLRSRAPVRPGWRVPSWGPRWKSELIQGGPPPPPAFVQQLFARTTTIQLLAAGESSERTGPVVDDASDWYCGCLLREDLDADSDSLDNHGWTCSRRRIGGGWSHAIVVDPENSTGCIVRVDRQPERIRLKKQIESIVRGDSSFVLLRKLAAETMLREVTRRAMQMGA